MPHGWAAWASLLVGFCATVTRSEEDLCYGDALCLGSLACGGFVNGTTLGGVDVLGNEAPDHFYRVRLGAGDPNAALAPPVEVMISSCGSEFDTYHRLLHSDGSSLAACDDCSTDCGGNSANCGDCGARASDCGTISNLGPLMLEPGIDYTRRDRGERTTAGTASR